MEIKPDYDEDVWNENYACGWPSVDLFVAAHSEFSDKAPDLATMFSKWELNTATLDEVLAYMSETGGEPVDAAIWFLKNKESIWTKFVMGERQATIRNLSAFLNART